MILARPYVVQPAAWDEYRAGNRLVNFPRSFYNNILGPKTRWLDRWNDSLGLRGALDCVSQGTKDESRQVTFVGLAEHVHALAAGGVCEARPIYAPRNASEENAIRDMIYTAEVAFLLVQQHPPEPKRP